LSGAREEMNLLLGRRDKSFFGCHDELREEMEIMPFLLKVISSFIRR
jgi:hypothetical protein